MDRDVDGLSGCHGGRETMLEASRAAGKMYPDLSSAYWDAVHAVLARKKTATQATQELQDKLQGMLKTSAVRANTELDKVPAHGR